MKKRIIPAEKTRTVIFVGPSLSEAAVLARYPTAWVHAPAKCGDILKVLRLNPHRIALIDGFFEQTASPWHKEILFALSLGVEVFGASSMGALRALELEPFGMRGIGKVFQDLKASQCPDDDEVCLAHTGDFSAQTPPLCNIRVTLDNAEIHGQVSATEKEACLTALKQRPYFERSFERMPASTRVITFCLETYIDQKKHDALELVSLLADTPYIQPTPLSPFSPTVFFYKIYREMMATPFDQPYPWLPAVEQSAVQLAQTPGKNAQKRLLKLFHLGYDLARRDRPTPPTQAGVLEWARNLAFEYPLEFSDATLERYLSWYDASPGIPPRTIRLTLMLLRALLATLDRMALHLQPEMYQQFANHFRHTRGLLNAAQTLSWVNQQPRTHEEPEDAPPRFNTFVRLFTPLYHFIELNNGHHLGVSPSLAAVSWVPLGPEELFSNKTVTEVAATTED